MASLSTILIIYKKGKLGHQNHVAILTNVS